MNSLSREKQIEIIAARREGVGQRTVTRLTGCDCKTVAHLTLRGQHRLLRSTGAREWGSRHYLKGLGIYRR